MKTIDIQSQETEQNTLVIDAEFEELLDNATDDDFAGVILAYGYTGCTQDPTCW